MFFWISVVPPSIELARERRKPYCQSPFSTAHRLAHHQERERDELSFLRDDSPTVRDLFEAAGEVVQESVLNSLCVADPVVGRDGNRAEAFPHQLLDAVPFLRRN